MFDRHFRRLIADAAEFSIKVISHRGFIAGDRFDIDELPRKRDSIHAGENSKFGKRPDAEVRSESAEVRSRKCRSKKSECRSEKSECRRRNEGKSTSGMLHPCF